MSFCGNGSRSTYEAVFAVLPFARFAVVRHEHTVFAKVVIARQSCDRLIRGQLLRSYAVMSADRTVEYLAGDITSIISFYNSNGSTTGAFTFVSTH